MCPLLYSTRSLKEVHVALIAMLLEKSGASPAGDELSKLSLTVDCCGCS